MTQHRLAETTRTRLDDVAEHARRDAEAPSLRAALFAADREVWSLDSGAVGTQYRIGSITKTFTAILVMRLRDEGRLNLNDRLGSYLDDSPYADATIRDLLAHRSGMTAEPAGQWWERTPGQDWATLAAANAAGLRVFDPGARYHYSNLGYGLLGQLISRVRGRAWYDVVHSELLVPLGMDETTYEPRTDAAGGTSRNPITGQLQSEPMRDTRAMAAAGQLWSTTADLGRWAGVLAGSEPDLISHATLREMRTAHSADVDEQHVGAYGLGLRLRWGSSQTLIGHTGSMPGFLAGLFVEPEDRLAGVLMVNCTTGVDTEAVITELIDVARQAAPSPIPLTEAAPPADPAVAELEGDWYWGNTALRLEATASGVELGSHRAHEWWRFEPSGTDLFIGVNGYTDGETLSVIRRADGSVSHLQVVTFVITKSPYDAEAPIPGGPPGPLT